MVCRRIYYCGGWPPTVFPPYPKDINDGEYIVDDYNGVPIYSGLPQPPYGSHTGSVHTDYYAYSVRLFPYNANGYNTAIQGQQVQFDVGLENN